jgi:class 3 adenylate cyclase
MALLEWHDREIRSAVAQYHGDVANHTGDGFFAAFERAADAIDCAVEIQRRLARHRQEHGFAPSIRIGLHTAEATSRGRDYGGRGVHVAARVGSAASGDEILASSQTLDAAGAVRFAVSEPRPLTLKGVREPIEARSLEWRT